MRSQITRGFNGTMCLGILRDLQQIIDLDSFDLQFE